MFSHALVCDSVSAWKNCGMIQLTRLNNKVLMVNSDLIKFVEQSPDTLVTLITGEKIVVLEKASEVLTRVIDFRRSVLQGLSLTWDPSASHVSISKACEPGNAEPER
jgi:flagellar protein FlbD